MVGLLNAPKNTKLDKRLKSENRLTIEATGNNSDSSMNFVPKMNTHELLPFTSSPFSLTSFWPLRHWAFMPLHRYTFVPLCHHV
jgi:hypothetical protein